MSRFQGKYKSWSTEDLLKELETLRATINKPDIRPVDRDYAIRITRQIASVLTSRGL